LNFFSEFIARDAFDPPDVEFFPDEGFTSLRPVPDFGEPARPALEARRGEGLGEGMKQS
jgi:hypothetical protein